MLRFLFFIAKRIDDGANHGEAERHQTRCTSTAHLFIPNVLLSDGPAGAAMFNWPMRGCPTFVRENLVPLFQERFFDRNADRRGFFHILRQRVFQEAAHLRAKRVIFGFE